MDWVKKSLEIDTLNTEIIFLLKDRFYFGNQNNPNQYNNNKFYEDVELPHFKRDSKLEARTCESSQYTDQLASYYETIIKKAYSHNIGLDDISHYFWMRLRLFDTAGKIRINFPWYDTLSQIQNFISWLKEDSESYAFDDLHQSWQLEAIRISDRLHIRETDPDENEEQANISIPFEPLLASALNAEARAKEIISVLSNKIGYDLWTYYPNQVE